MCRQVGFVTLSTRIRQHSLPSDGELPETLPTGSGVSPWSFSRACEQRHVVLRQSVKS